MRHRVLLDDGFKDDRQWFHEKPIREDPDIYTVINCLRMFEAKVKQL
jgi:hypothetical protein